MSVRAYRINKLEKEQNPTFNLWHHPELLDFFSEKEEIDVREQDIIEISVDTLQETINSINKRTLILRRGEMGWVKQALIKDLNWAINKNIDYIQYYCY